LLPLAALMNADGRYIQYNTNLWYNTYVIHFSFK
jgi:hypothetical protein